MIHSPSQSGLEPSLSRDWYAVADATRIAAAPIRTALFGQPMEVSRDRDGRACVRRLDGSCAPVVERYGFVWTCPTEPDTGVIEIPEANDVRRHVLCGGSFGVHASGLRVVENFLDMGHFPFVHTDYLGVEPHTEVAPYSVAVELDAVVATQCQFYQPVASPTAHDGIMVEYVFKVFAPFIVALYKTNPGYESERDFIALFIQPTHEERCIVHTFLAYMRKDIDAATVRWFMQLIFAQ
ncbi:MAG: aromatic ring-hydroxylating dioxygenase subunit alpha, partial [Chromatiales bacterium]|nr:aromatic ring-hydroxylating dioxygenase subunit alpha [Chromatiales bacterium]